MTLCRPSATGAQTVFSSGRKDAPIRRRLGDGKNAVEAGEHALFTEDFEKVIKTRANGFAGAGHPDGMDEQS